MNHMTNWTTPSIDSTEHIVLLCFKLTPQFFYALEMLLLQLAGVLHGLEERAYVVLVGDEDGHLVVHFQ